MTQVLYIQVAKDARVQMNPNAKTTASRIRYFTRMNTPTFYRFKMEEDPKGFIDEVFKVLIQWVYKIKKRRNYPPTNLMM